MNQFHKVSEQSTIYLEHLSLHTYTIKDNDFKRTIDIVEYCSCCSATCGNLNFVSINVDCLETTTKNVGFGIDNRLSVLFAFTSPTGCDLKRYTSSHNYRMIRYIKSKNFIRMNINRLKVSLGSLSTRTPLKVKSLVLVLYDVLKKSDRIPNRCRDRFDENSNSNAQKMVDGSGFCVLNICHLDFLCRCIKKILTRDSIGWNCQLMIF